MASVETDGATEEARRARDATEVRVKGRKKRRSKRTELIKVRPQEEVPMESSRGEELTLGGKLTEEESVPQAEERLEPERTIAPPARPRRDEDRVYEYLTQHGATRAPKIARDLNLGMSAVLDSLRTLRSQGKVRLR